MCDNCAFSKEIVDMDVTEHAKSLVTIVKETSDVDQKSTMLQLVDLWRSRARQPVLCEKVGMPGLLKISAKRMWNVLSFNLYWMGF